MSSDSVPQSGVPQSGEPPSKLVLAKQIKEAALGVEGVADIGKGWLREVATRLLEETVPGVAVEENSVELHLVAKYPSGFPILVLDERLRSTLEPLLGGRRLDLVVDDLAVAEELATVDARGVAKDLVGTEDLVGAEDNAPS